MATIQERLRRLRTGETPGTAASPSGGPENETGERRAAQSGGLTVTERLAKMRQDGEEISRQREAKEQQIQQARVDLLEAAVPNLLPGCDGLVCYNDQVAYQVLEVARRRGSWSVL